MDLFWLAIARKAVACIAGLRRLGEYVYGRFVWFSLIEERRREAQCKNDLGRIEVLNAHMKMSMGVLKLMREAGFTPAEIKAVMREMIVKRVRSHMSADGLVELRVITTKNKSGSSQTQHFEERRSVQLVSVDAAYSKRVGDADRR